MKEETITSIDVVPLLLNSIHAFCFFSDICYNLFYAVSVIINRSGRRPSPSLCFSLFVTKNVTNSESWLGGTQLPRERTNSGYLHDHGFNVSNKFGGAGSGMPVNILYAFARCKLFVQSCLIECYWLTPVTVRVLINGQQNPELLLWKLWHEDLPTGFQCQEVRWIATPIPNKVDLIEPKLASIFRQLYPRLEFRSL